MYEPPRLERIGTFRDLTGQGTPSKTVIGDDLVPGVGMDCDGAPTATPQNACRS
jgi:hypothetical protein